MDAESWKHCALSTQLLCRGRDSNQGSSPVTLECHPFSLLEEKEF